MQRGYIESAAGLDLIFNMTFTVNGRSLNHAVTSSNFTDKYSANDGRANVDLSLTGKPGFVEDDAFLGLYGIGTAHTMVSRWYLGTADLGAHDVPNTNPGGSFSFTLVPPSRIFRKISDRSYDQDRQNAAADVLNGAVNVVSSVVSLVGRLVSFGFLFKPGTDPTAYLSRYRPTEDVNDPWYVPGTTYRTNDPSGDGSTPTFSPSPTYNPFTDTGTWEGVGVGYAYSILGGGKIIGSNGTSLRGQAAIPPGDSSLPARIPLNTDSVPVVFNGDFQASQRPLLARLPTTSSFFQIPGWSYQGGSGGVFQGLLGYHASFSTNKFWDFLKPYITFAEDAKASLNNSINTVVGTLASIFNTTVKATTTAGGNLKTGTIAFVKAVGDVLTTLGSNFMTALKVVGSILERLLDAVFDSSKRNLKVQFQNDPNLKPLVNLFSRNVPKAVQSLPADDALKGAARSLGSSIVGALLQWAQASLLDYSFTLHTGLVGDAAGYSSITHNRMYFPTDQNTLGVDVTSVGGSGSVAGLLVVTAVIEENGQRHEEELSRFSIPATSQDETHRYQIDLSKVKGKTATLTFTSVNTGSVFGSAPTLRIDNIGTGGVTIEESSGKINDGVIFFDDATNTGGIDGTAVGAGTGGVTVGKTMSDGHNQQTFTIKNTANTAVDFSLEADPNAFLIITSDNLPKTYVFNNPNATPDQLKTDSIHLDANSSITITVQSILSQNYIDSLGSKQDLLLSANLRIVEATDTQSLTLFYFVDLADDSSTDGTIRFADTREQITRSVTILNNGGASADTSGWFDKSPTAQGSDKYINLTMTTPMVHAHETQAGRLTFSFQGNEIGSVNLIGTARQTEAIVLSFDALKNALTGIIAARNVPGAPNDPAADAVAARLSEILAQNGSSPLTNAQSSQLLHSVASAIKQIYPGPTANGWLSIVGQLNIGNPDYAAVVPPGETHPGTAVLKFDTDLFAKLLLKNPTAPIESNADVRTDLTAAQLRYRLDTVMNENYTGDKPTIYMVNLLKQLALTSPQFTLDDVGNAIGWLLSHEYGHLFGLFDERAASGTPSFMSTFDNTSSYHLQRRLFQFIFNDNSTDTIDPAELTALIDYVHGLAVADALQNINNPSKLRDGPGDAPVSSGVGAGAGYLLNGDFSVGDSEAIDFGWSLVGGGIIGDGKLTLDENATVTSRAYQEFVVPANGHELQFKVLATNFVANPGGPQDAFEVALLRASDMQSLAGTIALLNTDAALNIQSDGTLHTASRVSTSGDLHHGAMTVTIDLTGVEAGTVVRLYFDLLGFGALGSAVTVDDVQFTDAGPVNTAPVASDVTTLALEDGPAVVVAAIYSDADDADIHTFAINNTGTKGKVTNNGDGSFTYDPNGAFEKLKAGATATDTFTYTVSDGAGATSTATVTVTIAGQNDAPTASDATAAVQASGPCGHGNGVICRSGRGRHPHFPDRHHDLCHQGHGHQQR